MSFLDKAWSIISTGEAPIKTPTQEQKVLADQKRAQATHALAHPTPAAAVAPTQHTPATHHEAHPTPAAAVAPTQHTPAVHSENVAPVAPTRPNPAPEAPVTVNVIKGYGYFEKRINEIKGLSKYLEGLILAIKILQYFPKGAKNHPILETMGIERGEIVEILRSLFGEFNEEYKEVETISLIGDMNGRGNIKRFLFEDILQFNDQTGNKTIDTIVPKFFNQLTQFDLAKNPFFQMKNLKKYLEIVVSIGSGKAIFDDPHHGITKGELIGEKAEIDFVRNALNLPNRNMPKMDFLAGLDESKTETQKQPSEKIREPEMPIPNEILEAAHESVAEDDEIQGLLSLADILTHINEDETIRGELTKLNNPLFDHFLENSDIPSASIMEHLLKVLKKQGKVLSVRTVALHLKNLAHESIADYQSTAKGMEPEKK